MNQKTRTVQVGSETQRRNRSVGAATKRNHGVGATMKKNHGVDAAMKKSHDIGAVTKSPLTQRDATLTAKPVAGGALVTTQRIRASHLNMKTTDDAHHH